jgi:hypothetical protein
MTQRTAVSLLLTIISFLFTSRLSAGPPFKTDDPQPVDLRHWEFYIASMQQFESGAMNATLPHFEINYGVVPNVQLHVVAPVGYVHTGEATQYGYSDTEVGVKYRFLEETSSAPQVGIFPLIELPTGNEGRQLGSGTVQAFIPVWVQKSWGKLTTYGGGGVWYNPGEGRQHWLFAGGEVQYDCSEAVTLGTELYYQTADTPDAGATAGFNIGGTINLTDHDHILFSFGRTASAAAVVTGYLGYQLTI